jgi:hypothetical protein
MSACGRFTRAPPKELSGRQSRDNSELLSPRSCRGFAFRTPSRSITRHCAPDRRRNTRFGNRVGTASQKPIHLAGLSPFLRVTGSAKPVGAVKWRYRTLWPGLLTVPVSFQKPHVSFPIPAEACVRHSTSRAFSVNLTSKKANSGWHVDLNT